MMRKNLKKQKNCHVCEKPLLVSLDYYDPNIMVKKLGKHIKHVMMVIILILMVQEQNLKLIIKNLKIVSFANKN